MPFVIDEVVINIEVPQGPAAPAPPGGGGGGADRQALVAEIVEQVLDILQRRDEP
jgi:Family of unknown function (DUF5908)